MIEDDDHMQPTNRAEFQAPTWDEYFLDIAKAVYFFLSDLSPWASGATLAIDGGGTA